jgi:hypothetical protein
MATQVIGAGRRFRMRAALVGLALTFAVLVLATQASSIWSTTPGSSDLPVSAQVDQPFARDWQGGSGVSQCHGGGCTRSHAKAVHRGTVWEIAGKHP